MEQKLAAKRLIIRLSGILFVIYAAYNIFVIIRGGGRLSQEGRLISALVASMFILLAFFAFTSESKNAKFLIARNTLFIIVLLVIFVLKMRMIGQVIDYIDFSKTETLVYGAAYFMTQLALLFLFIHYAFTLRTLPRFYKAPLVLPILALILLICSFILEAILYFVYGTGLEANQLRTAVSRPVFYLGFIGISIYSLFPLQKFSR